MIPELSVHAASKKDCGDFLFDDDDQLSEKEKRLGVSHRLLDVVKNSPDNLAVNHPSIVMNAAQRILAIVLSQGVKEIPNPEAPGTNIKYYPFFSEGLSMTNGRRVVGNEVAIARFVEQLKHRTQGDPNVMIFLGPHGTGKTEILEVLSAGLTNATTHLPEHYFYTFEWHSLAQIPSLKSEFEISEELADSHTLPSFLNDSPLVLLPDATQEKLIQYASPMAEKLIGMQAKPMKLEGSPWDTFIQEEIFKYYSAKKGSPLTVKERIEYTDKHVRVIPITLGTNGTAPKFDAQNRDVDIRSLFVTQNLAGFLRHGAGHPLSDRPNGSILRGNGSVVFLDEFLRNKKELLNLFLGIFQSGRAAISGSRPISMDAVFVTAGNYESLEELRAEGGSSAVINRLKVQPFPWPVNPYDIMATLTYILSQTTEFEMRKLGDANSEWVKASTSELFPRAPAGSRLREGPDRRYELRVKSAGRTVYISPHTLLFYSGFLSMTRSIYDQGKARKAGADGMSILESGVFKQPVLRLRFWMGEASLKGAEEQELLKVSSLLQEGHHIGMSTRDFDRWFKESLSHAIRIAGEGEAVLTPEIAKSVLMTQLDQHIIDVDTKTALQWRSQFAESMAKSVILPRLRSDIHMALGHMSGQSEMIYDQVIAEIMALANDPGARQYMDPNSSTYVNIDLPRLEAIKKEYFNASNGQTLDYPMIALSHAAIVHGGRKERKPELLNAITNYYSKLTTRSFPMSAFLGYSKSQGGDSQIGPVYQTLMGTLKNDFGYHEKAALDALNFVIHYDSMGEQIKQSE